MKKRLLYILLTAGLVAAAALAAFTLPASAELRTITVRLVTGEVVTVTVDVPPGTPLSEIEVPGVIVNEPAAAAPSRRRRPDPAPKPEPAPRSPGGNEQEKTTRQAQAEAQAAPGGGDVRHSTCG